MGVDFSFADVSDASERRPYRQTVFFLLSRAGYERQAVERRVVDVRD
jgi:hypothetical protein